MLNKQRQSHPKQWSRGDYAPNVIIRFLLLIVLWVFYSFVPHKLETAWLILITAIMLVYAYQLYKRKSIIMMPLMLLAAVINTILIPLLTKGINTIIPIALIFFILLLDIIWLPQEYK